MSCRTGKRRYGSMERALKVAAKVKGYNRPYLCNLCGGWHLTSQHPKRRVRG